MRTWTIFAGLVVAGCTTQAVPPGPDDLSMPSDLSMPAPSPDLAGVGLIGNPCVANSGCHEGKMPVCWARSLYNNSGYIAVPSGYSSRWERWQLLAATRLASLVADR